MFIIWFLFLLLLLLLLLLFFIIIVIIVFCGTVDHDYLSIFSKSSDNPLRLMVTRSQVKWIFFWIVLKNQFAIVIGSQLFKSFYYSSWNPIYTLLNDTKYHLQSFTKYLRLTPAFMWNSALWEKFSFCLFRIFR